MSMDKKIILAASLLTIFIFIGSVWFFNKSGFNSATPTTIASEKIELLKVGPQDHILGAKDAAVTLVEYLDFECEVCGIYNPLMKQLTEEFKNEVQFVSRYFPLAGHKNSFNAALAVESAHKQGKYQEMFNLLFDDQKSWGGKPTSDPKIFETYAKQINLNLELFKKDFLSSEVRNRIDQDRISGEKLGVDGTPSFFLNDEKLQNPRTLEDFRILIKAAILRYPKVSTSQLGEKVHEHADLKIYLNGKALDLTQAKYQSTHDKEIDPNTHLHDGNGNIVHKHREGVTLGYFLKTLKIDLTKDCLTLDTGTRYCNDNRNSLKLLVNNIPNNQFATYEFSDLDRILISYGPKDQSLDNQLKSVTDMACIYSEKCPERGKPPTESCVGGLGDDC